MGKSREKGAQLGLIPLKTQWCAPNLGSADLKLICRCDDGLDYAIKPNEPRPGVRGSLFRTAHDEYFCYRLGQIVGIPTPNYHFVEMPDGTLAFGSRWEAGDQPNLWWNQIAAGTITGDQILPTLARIYVFDLFIHNVDRHAGNLLVRRQHLGHAVIAFDYSRAWTYHGFPPPALPMDPTENTVLLQRQLSSLLGAYVATPAARQVLDNIDAVSHKQIRDLLLSQPAKWLTKPLSSSIVKWWKSSAKSDRVASIRTGINNGSLL
jgi:hypothetical protein